MVVGAGIAGCAAAYALTEAGGRVLVVDRGGIGAGASGRNGGFLFRQPAGWISLAERAVRVAPNLAGVPVVASWSGRWAMTPDGVPVVGDSGPFAAERLA